MATILITTPGAATANSYATWEEYKTYWGLRLFNTVPLAATQLTAEMSLAWACLLLNALLRWTGSAVDDVQALSWPRNGMFSANGFPILSTNIPKALKDAQSEYAGNLLLGDRTADDPDSKTLGSDIKITSVKAGPVALSFDNSSFTSLESFDAYIRSLGSDFGYLSKAMPDSVRALLPPSWYAQAQLKRKVLFGAF